MKNQLTFTDISDILTYYLQYDIIFKLILISLCISKVMIIGNQIQCASSPRLSNILPTQETILCRILNNKSRKHSLNSIVRNIYKIEYSFVWEYLKETSSTHFNFCYLVNCSLLLHVCCGFVEFWDQVWFSCILHDCIF